MAQRNTWQRERVREALADARGFVSAQTLHASLRDDNTGIGLATVYRALAGTLPVSPYITTLSFTIYVVCWIVQRSRARVRRVRV